MHRLAAILALAGYVAACGYSVDEVKDTPVQLRMTVPVAWDRVGTCLAAAYATDFEALYLPVPSEQRAQLIVKYVGIGIVPYKSIAYVYEISGGPPATITVRSPPPHSEAANRLVRDKVQGCGKL